MESDNDVQILLDAGEHSSKMIWEVFVNATDTTIINYAVKMFGHAETKVAIGEAEEYIRNTDEIDEDVQVLLDADEHSSKTIWDTFTCVSAFELASYAIKHFGLEEVKKEFAEIPEK